MSGPKVMDTPGLGATVVDKTRPEPRQRYTVGLIFNGTSHPAMLLDWRDSDGIKRGQCFTCKDWRDRWEVVFIPCLCEGATLDGKCVRCGRLRRGV